MPLLFGASCNVYTRCGMLAAHLPGGQRILGVYHNDPRVWIGRTAAIRVTARGNFR